jgi:hypothetical protein
MAGNSGQHQVGVSLSVGSSKSNTGRSLLNGIFLLQVNAVAYISHTGTKTSNPRQNLPDIHCSNDKTVCKGKIAQTNAISLQLA